MTDLKQEAIYQQAKGNIREWMDKALDQIDELSNEIERIKNSKSNLEMNIRKMKGWLDE